MCVPVCACVWGTMWQRAVAGLTFATMVIFLDVTKRFCVRLPHGRKVVVVSLRQTEL